MPPPDLETGALRKKQQTAQALEEDTIKVQDHELSEISVRDRKGKSSPSLSPRSKNRKRGSLLFESPEDQQANTIEDGSQDQDTELADEFESVVPPDPLII